MKFKNIREISENHEYLHELLCGAVSSTPGSIDNLKPGPDKVMPEIELTLIANGVELDVAAWAKDMDERIEDVIQRRVTKILALRANDAMADVYDALNQIENLAKQKIEELTGISPEDR